MDMAYLALRLRYRSYRVPYALSNLCTASDGLGFDKNSICYRWAAVFSGRGSYFEFSRRSPQATKGALGLVCCCALRCECVGTSCLAASAIGRDTGREVGDGASCGVSAG